MLLFVKYCIFAKTTHFMPVNIDIISRKVLTQLVNGDDFLTDTSNNTINLASNVMERQKIVQKIWLSWNTIPNAANIFTYTYLGGDIYKITRGTGSFIADGFATGDAIYWDNNVINPSMSPNNNGTIISVNEIDITIQFVGSNSTSGNVNYGTLWGNEPIQSLILSYGLNGNDAPFSIKNYVTNNDQNYYLSGITSTFQEMLPMYTYKDWVSGGIQIKKNTNPSTYVQEFEIEHEFIIPYYQESEEVNLQNNTIPDYLLGDNSLKDVYKFDFRTVISNPMSSKVKQFNTNKGSVGYFGENFNGFRNDYTIDSIVYKDNLTGVVVDSLVPNKTTKVEVLISTTGTPFATGWRVGAYHSYLPTIEQYSNTLTTFESNFLYQSKFVEIGAEHTDYFGLPIVFMKCEIVATKLKITLLIQYSTDQQKQIAETNNYLLGFQVADMTAGYNAGNINKVILKEYNTYTAAVDIEGLMELTNHRLYQHDEDVNTGIGSTDKSCFIEDTIYSKYEFRLDVSKEAIIQGLKLELMAYDGDNSFNLDSFIIPVDTSIIKAGVQQLEYVGKRAYIDFNDITLITGVFSYPYQNYTLIIPQKMSWQTWMKQVDVDTIFYDKTKPLNNLNKKATNYAGLNGYDIRIGLVAAVEGVSDLGERGITNYRFLTPPIAVKDYNDSTITTEIKTFDSISLVDLGGKVKTDSNTIMKAIHTKVGGFTSVAGFWAIHRIEKSQQQGYNIEELSSLYDTVRNKIKPIIGSLLSIELVGDEIHTSCIIDYTQLEKSASYNLSARINEGFINVPFGAIKDDPTGNYILDEEGNYIIEN